MIRIIYFAIFILIFSYGLGRAQDPYPLVQDNDLPDWKVSDTRFYSGEALYRYIDGGAEIYFEYGFDRVAVQKFIQEKSGQELQVEIFRMSDSLAALGIFTYFRRQCRPTPSLSLYFCDTPFQLIFARGNYYVSITNFKGDSLAGKNSRQLARKLLARIPGTDPTLPGFFNNPILAGALNKLIFVRGPLGLQAHATNWENWFTGISDFELFLLPLDDLAPNTRIGLLTLANTGDWEQLLDHLGFPAGQVAPGAWSVLRPKNRSSLAVFLLSSNQAIVCESTADPPALKRLLTEIQSGQVRVLPPKTEY